MNARILLVEDEQALQMTIADRLQSEGYAVECVGDGEQGLEKATHTPFDLIILDIMLPVRNGLDICRDIRQAGLATPILFLTARTQTVDKVVGLKLGGDDYLTKPFEMIELVARVEAILRRVITPAKPSGSVQQFGTVRVDLRGTAVTRAGEPVSLSAREFQLLRYLVENRGRTLSRDEILREVWGYSEATFTRTVDVHVAGLRQKLEEDPKKPELIVTVPGLGYKLAR